MTPLEGHPIEIQPLAPHLLDHRGQPKFVEMAYKMEEYLGQQPAHIAAEISLEQHTTSALRKKWNDTHLDFQTTILPTPPVASVLYSVPLVEGLAQLTHAKAQDVDLLVPS